MTARAGPAPIRVAARTPSRASRHARDVLRSAHVAAVILLTLLCSTLPAAGAEDPVPLPTYDIGHIWPLADAAYELVRMEDDVYVFASPNAEIRLTRSLGLVSVRRGDDFVEIMPGAQLTWPLKAGD